MLFAPAISSLSWRDAFGYVVLSISMVSVIGYLLHQLWTRRRDSNEFTIYTAMDDLGCLGMRRWRNKISGTAVVIGGSMIGLITARICADHFERVIIVEADEGADTAFPSHSRKKDAYGNSTFVSRRPRVAQMFEIHFYQPFALLALRRLFSDFDRKLSAAGGRIKPWNFRALWSGIRLGIPTSDYLGGYGLPRHPCLPKEDLPNTIWFTCSNFEPFLRNQVLNSCPNISVFHGTATGLAQSSPRRLNKVVYFADGTTKELDASLVVDCTGHSKAGAKWLEHLGYGPISQVSYDPQLRYASIILSFGGFGIDPRDLPRTVDDLKDFYRGMQTLDGKQCQNAYEECKIPPCVFVKYHEADNLPFNYVALGDAVMRASPVYGLGVTKGIVGAVTLGGLLAQVKGTSVPEWFSKTLFDSQNKRTAWIWDQSKEADYAHSTTIPCEGDTLEVGEATRAITKEFFKLTTFDEEAAARFYYSRLWIYPNSVMLSKRVLNLCLEMMKEKESPKEEKQTEGG